MAVRRTTLMLATVSLALPTTASARTPTTLAPLQPWNLHYAENSCQLIRTFGDPARPTTLVLERIAPDASMSLMVFGGGLSAKMGTGKGEAAFLPFDDHSFDHGDIAETVDARSTAILWSRIDLLPGWEKDATSRKPRKDESRDPARRVAMLAHEDATAARITGLRIKEPLGRSTVLKTGALSRANAMMRECAREQMVSWGLDPAVQDRIVRPARSERDLARYFSSADYPRRALVQGQQSVISARLIVDAEGKATRCTSLTKFSAEGFAEVACRNLSSATFRPAELADGSKVPSYTIANVRFQMP
jgi:hypothetical protein